MNLSKILLKIARKLDPSLEQPQGFHYGQFDCIKCNMPFMPAVNQDIKYRLCNVCFIEFNRQRTAGRSWLKNHATIVQPSFYTESVKEWMEHETGERR